MCTDLILHNILFYGVILEIRQFAEMENIYHQIYQDDEKLFILIQKELITDCYFKTQTCYTMMVLNFLAKFDSKNLLLKLKSRVLESPVYNGCI